MSIDDLQIASPKRNSAERSEWEAFFPYYAGFPERFARQIIGSAGLGHTSCVLDPWNGSGTTTFAASKLGFGSVGIDLNPVMVLVARSRCLPPSEADALQPLGREILRRSERHWQVPITADPLYQWFGRETSSWLRSVERACCAMLLSDQTQSGGPNLENISAIAATFYVAVFTVCREVARSYQSSNPTWLRNLRDGQRRASWPKKKLDAKFLEILQKMTSALEDEEAPLEYGPTRLRIHDTTTPLELDGIVDLVLTSPPYCTRLDYTAATKLQLGIIWPMLNVSPGNLSRNMTGSVRVPEIKLAVKDEWGYTCTKFLRDLASHPSKASSGYYFQTHADYFSKMFSSLGSVSRALKSDGIAVIVVQDSYYKELHNDVPRIISEMAEGQALKLARTERFPLRNTLAGRHPHTKNYRKKIEATEAVLCFRKI